MINDLIKTLVNYAIKNDLITLDDEVYCINRILRFLKLDSYTDGEILELSFDNLIEEFINYAVEKELIKVLYILLLDDLILYILVYQKKKKKFQD